MINKSIKNIEDDDKFANCTKEFLKE